MGQGSEPKKRRQLATVAAVAAASIYLAAEAKRAKAGMHATPKQAQPLLDPPSETPQPCGIAEPSGKPDPRAAMEPLDREKLVARTSEVSPTGFLTIISVLQGIAAGILANNASKVIEQGSHVETLVWLQTVAVLAILVFVFHFYTATSPFTRWPPSFLDSLIPFIVGGCEIPPTFFLGTTAAWCYSVAALCGIAAGGLITTGISTTEDHFRNVDAHARFRQILVQVGSVAICTGALVSACVPLADHTDAGPLLGGLVAASAVILAVGIMATTMERALCYIYDKYGVARPFFL